MARRNGFTLIEAIVVIAILGVLLGLMMAGIHKARDTAARAECGNHLRQIGLALHAHHDRSKALPAGIVNPFGSLAKGQFRHLTWHMAILPFLEQDAVWAQIQAAYAQDSSQLAIPPHTATNIPIAMFQCPGDGDRPSAANGSSPGLTSYLGVSGRTWTHRDGLFYLDSKTTFAAVRDGLSNTLAVGERPPSQEHIYGRWHGSWGPWGDANSYLGVREVGLGVVEQQCGEGPHVFQPGRLSNGCSVLHYWSFHAGGANFLVADGSVRFLGYSAALLLPALATRAGAEPDLP